MSENLILRTYRLSPLATTFWSYKFLTRYFYILHKTVVSTPVTPLGEGRRDGGSRGVWKDGRTKDGGPVTRGTQAEDGDVDT